MNSVTALPEQTVAREATPSRSAAPLARVVAAVRNPAMRRGMLGILDQAVTSGASFATSVIVGRMCSQSDLGVYYLALSVVLLVRSLQGDLITSPYMIYCSRRQGESLARYGGSTFAHHFFTSALTVGILASIVGAVGVSGGSTALTTTGWAMVGALPFLLLREHVRYFAFAHLQAGVAIALDLAVAVLQLGSLALLAYLDLLSVELVYAVMGLCCAIPCVGWFFFTRHPLQFRWGSILADWWSNWDFAKWALASQLANRTSSFVMPWIVAIVHGEAATGMLAACITVVNLAGTFVTGVNNLLTSEASHAIAWGGHSALKRVLRRAAVVFVVTLGAFFLVVLALGDVLAVFIFGNQFAGSGPTLTALAFAMLASSVGLTAGNGLWALDVPRANFSADVCMMIVTLVAAVCLVHPLGVLGAALAMAAGTVAGSLLRVFTLRRLLAAADERALT